MVGLGGGPGRIAIAARHPARSDRLVLAIDTDGAAAAAPPRDRDRLRPEHLVRLGWAVHRVWSPAWADDPDRETERLLATYADAVTTADAYDWAEAAAQADAVVGMPDSGDEEADGVDADEGPSTSRTPCQSAGPGLRRGWRGDVPSARTRATNLRPWRAGSTPTARRAESDLIDVLADELRLADRGPRVDDALRHAVRVARAGAPPLWTSPP